MTPVRHKSRDDAGFSLLEVLIGLAIVGLVSGLAGMALESVRRSRQLAGAVSLFTKMVASARNGAIGSGAPHRLIFDPVTHAVLVPEASRQVHLPAEASLTLTTAIGISTSDRPSILFLPDGTGSGGRITVTIGERARTIRVSWLTGAITDEP